MASAQVTLRGRFSPGTVVRLVEVDSEAALRAEGGREVDTKRVDKDGMVQFKTGVREGGRYFIVGLNDGFPLEVRARGRSAENDSEVLAQAPIGPDRVRLSDGSWADEAPERVSPPKREVGPAPGQHQVPKGVVQRSDTPRGTAHPLDPKEPAPYRSQEDVKKGTVQMSDTPGYTDAAGREVHGGRATELAVGPQRQEDVPKGVVQRSATPTGTATPIPDGDAIEAQRVKESSEAKEKRGEPGRAAAEPISGNRPVKGATAKQSADRHAKVLEDVREAPGKEPGEVVPGTEADTSGRDAQGQPVAEDVAAATGVDPASKPAEPVRAPRKSKRSSGGSARSARAATGSKSTTAKKETK